MQEPGLDLHEWETRWHELEPQLEDAPGETLPELADLMEAMLEQAGYQLAEPTTVEGDEREITAEFLAAREVADRLERDEEVDPGDVGSAVNGFRAIYEFLSATRPGDTAV